MVELKIRLLVKFRFLKMDLGKVDKTFRVGLGAGLTFEEISEPLPPHAHTVLNERGIKLSVWQ